MAGTNYSNDPRNEDSYADIPQNRTLLAEKLTQEPALIPQVAHGLETVDQVFKHYQPAVEVRFENADGHLKKETLSFNSVADFGIDSIMEQSKFLKASMREKDQYLKIIKQLKSNPGLNAALADGETKASLLQAIHTMIEELKQHK